MHYRQEIHDLFQQGQDARLIERADALLAEHPTDIWLADTRHRARKRALASELTFSNEWFPTWQPMWVEAMAKMGWDRTKRHQIIEIGAFEGQCTSWLSDVLIGSDESRVIVIDPFTGSMEHSDEQKDALFDRFSANTRQLGSPQRIVVKQGMSGDVLPQLICQNVQADLIYIDGSHLARDVLADAVMAWRLLVPGGILVFDDYMWPLYRDNPALHPKMGIDAFVNCYLPELRMVIWGQSYQQMFIKSPVQ